MQKLLLKRPWIQCFTTRFIGNGILVTLTEQYRFVADPDCTVRGFDTIRELLAGTKRSEVILLSECSTRK